MKKLKMIAATAALLLCFGAAPASAGDSDSDSGRAKYKKMKKIKKAKKVKFKQHRPQSNPIPEPGAALLFGLGAAGAAYTTKRRR